MEVSARAFLWLNLVDLYSQFVHISVNLCTGAKTTSACIRVFSNSSLFFDYTASIRPGKLRSHARIARSVWLQKKIFN